MTARFVVILSLLLATVSALSASSRRSFVKNAFAAAVAGPFLVPKPASAGLPETGVKAPPFELPNSRGEGMTTLSELTKAGKWTVLYFYPGAFTSGCTLEARGFQSDIQQYRQLNAQIVGVSIDPVEKNAQFCTAESLDFFMLSDSGGKVSKAYGSAVSIPGFGTFSNRQTYLIDPSGNLRWVFTDVESRISRHSGEVLEKLGELTA
jgi:peroxiredoxin Q/BCP